MNDFAKTFFLALYNSILKINLNCDTENEVLKRRYCIT